MLSTRLMPALALLAIALPTGARAQQASSICVIGHGSCQIERPKPVGAPCVCPVGGGWVQGTVR